MALVIVGGLLLRATNGVTAWDVRILNEVADLQSPPLTALSHALDWLFSPMIGTVVLVLIAAAIVAVTRRIRPAAFFVGLVVIPWLATEVVKVIVRRPRPGSPALVHPLSASPTSFSYPSGHTSLAAALCVTLLVLCWSTRARPYLIVVAGIVPLLTAFSRMYLGVHYLTDVVASLIFTSAAIAALVLVGSSILARVGRHGE